MDPTRQPTANLGLVLGIGGGVLGLGVILTLVHPAGGCKKDQRQELTEPLRSDSART